jgi:hypothetical protein
MRIISKFQDYYDSALGYGIDKTLTYVREMKGLEIDIPIGTGHRSREYCIFIIGFCGKLYPCIRTWREPTKQEDPHSILGHIPNFHHDEDKCLEIIEDSNNWKWHLDEVLDKFKALKNNNKLLELFQEYKTPVFIVREQERSSDNNLIINPCLKDHQFFKVIDAYSAFQEISMYVGGVLPRREPDTVDVSEACKTNMHGMDSWSFRKKGPNSKQHAKVSKGKKCK